ncbi:MAG: hypothetical protein IJ859_13180 [Synergistaceae bacterium]|nr:hypothetical protein [Synergistaceae bacterium]MBR2209752.1 hypothetical protein [Synergistaceae bacterium]
MEGFVWFLIFFFQFIFWLFNGICLIFDGLKWVFRKLFRIKPKELSTPKRTRPYTQEEIDEIDTQYKSCIEELEKEQKRQREYCDKWFLNKW